MITYDRDMVEKRLVRYSRKRIAKPKEKVPWVILGAIFLIILWAI